MAGLTYRDAGVDIEAGDELIDRIKPLARSTHTPHVLGGLGGFAGLCALPDDIEDPILVAGTDGVGTKLKLAFELGRHETVGIDLVAMCVNDIVTCGARPLFFLDYFATGRLDVDEGEAVVKGIAEGCREAECALLGGETAELPGFYKRGEYDLAGFAVGVVSRHKLLDGTRVNEGDVVLGLPSSGLHSNGYSLARRALFEHGEPMRLDAPFGATSLGDTLLTPTRIYARAAQAAIGAGAHALCHITGGGLPGNLPRVLPADLGIELDVSTWSPPEIFSLIQKRGGVSEEEMRSTFNLGIGFVAIADAASAPRVINAIKETNPGVARVGSVVRGDGVRFVGG